MKCPSNRGQGRVNQTGAEIKFLLFQNKAYYELQRNKTIFPISLICRHRLIVTVMVVLSNSKQEQGKEGWSLGKYYFMKEFGIVPGKTPQQLDGCMWVLSRI